MYKNYSCFFVLFLILGCGSYNIQNYGTIDLTQKSVTVPAGSGGLKGDLKKVLSELGWKLSVDIGPSVIEGKLDKETKIQAYDTFNTRYRLHVKSTQFDLCLNFSPAIFYDISFIDNKTGKEIFTLDGRGCQSGVVANFRKSLLGISK